MTHRAIQSLRVFKTVTKSHNIHPQRRGPGALLRLSFIKHDSSSQNPGSGAKQGSPPPTLPLQNHAQRGGIGTLALPSPRGMSVGQELAQGLGPPQPQLGHSNSKCPARMEIIHLARPALHRLGTDEAASKGRPGKQLWREAEAAAAWHRGGLGAEGASVLRGWGRAATNSHTPGVGFVWGCSGGCSPPQTGGYPTKPKS